MSSDVSNKTILALLVVAVVVSLGGTMLSVSKLSGMGGQYALLTGYATQETASANIQISTTSSISLTDANIQLPTGYFNTSCTTNIAVVNSNGSAGNCWLNSSGIEPWNSSDQARDFITIQNNGTGPISVSVYTSDLSANTTLCSGSSSCGTTEGNGSFWNFTAYQAEPNSCGSGLASTDTEFLNNSGGAGSNNGPVTVCSNLNAADDKDEINVSFMVGVPKDAVDGTKTLSPIFSASSAT